MNNIKLCSGYGFKHSEHYKPLNTVTWDEITALVDSPQGVPKEGPAQWMIPSTLITRLADAQRSKGEYWILWADLDDTPPVISVVANFIAGITGGCRYEVYTSKSATIKKPKSRVLIPLAKALNASEWEACQEVLNDKLAGASITPDRHSEGVYQLCFLPNKGEHYETESNRIGGHFDPLAEFSEELASKFEEIEAKPNYQRLDYQPPISVSSGTTPFGRGGLNGEIAALRITGEGARNAQLNTAAFSIGQLVAGGEVTESDARAELEAAASNIGLTPQEIKPTLNSGLKAGKLNPRSAPPKDGDINQVDNSAQGDNPTPTISALERLEAFTANGLSGDMKRQMLEDKYVVDGIALLGQWTTIYASPSSGKTLIILHELMESVSNGVIKGEDVFYVNVDDSYKGQTNKLKLLEEAGIQALIPNQRGFKANALLPLMEELTREGTAKEKTFILDTMKKFTDLMDKKMATDFGNIARGFVQAGGTLICLAHTNKHKDAEGKSVHAGTSDIVDDCDCAYIIEASAPDHSGKRRAKFKNIKSRGNVAQKVTFEYTVIEGGDYETLLNSVKRLNDKDAKAAGKENRLINDIAAAKDLVDAIRLELKDGGLNSKDLLKAVREETTFSRNAIKDAMKKWDGADYNAGHRWLSEKAGKRELIYKNLDNPAEKAAEAMLAKARLRGDIKDPRDIMGGFTVDDYEPDDYRED